MSHSGDARHTAGSSDPHDRIRLRAYELYMSRGGSHGGDFDDWLAAERELADRGEPSALTERVNEDAGVLGVSADDELAGAGAAAAAAAPQPTGPNGASGRPAPARKAAAKGAASKPAAAKPVATKAAAKSAPARPAAKSAAKPATDAAAAAPKKPAARSRKSTGTQPEAGGGTD
jgi:hypothetical protein